MNNLKRVLSLALSGIMLVGMMAMGAGAADFTDADDIVHTEAVNVLVALKVINGKDDGSFDPNGDVTRAEMAKMIAVTMNGGTDANTGTKTTPSFTDIKGHWAESYIEYCADLGIISGRGDGTFDPNGKVTGLEATKMVLSALGFDATAYKLTGASWAVRTDEVARTQTGLTVDGNKEPNLYEELTSTVLATNATREVAAQLIWNGLQNHTRIVNPETNTNTGEVQWRYDLGANTLLKQRYDADVVTGTYAGNFKTGAADYEGEIAVSKSGSTYSVPSDLGIENIGEEVKVVWKEGNRSLKKGGPDRNDTIFGVFNTGATEVAWGTMADVGNYYANLGENEYGRIKLGSDTFTAAKSVAVIYDYKTDNVSRFSTTDCTALDTNRNIKNKNSSLVSELQGQSVDKIKLVTDPNSGHVTTAYVVHVYAGQVTGLTNSKITISGVGAIDRASNDIFEDVELDDVVVYNKLYDDASAKAYFVVTKAETVEGTLEGFKFGDKDESEDTSLKNIVIDGTTYKTHNAPDALDELTDDPISVPVRDDLGNSVRAYLADGMVVALQSLETSGGNYAVITSTDLGDNGIGATLLGWNIEVLMGDGKEGVYAIHKDSTVLVEDEYVKLNTLDDADDLIVEGALIEFSITGSKIKIKDIALPVALDEDASKLTGEKVWNKTTKALTYAEAVTKDGTTTYTRDSAVGASNAVAFVFSEKNDGYYNYNLRSLGNIDATWTVKKNGSTETHIAEVAYFMNKDNQIKAAYMYLGGKPGSNTADTLYGIVTGRAGNRKVNGEQYIGYTVALDEDTNKTIYVDGYLPDDSGVLVQFDEASDECYAREDIIVITSAEDLDAETDMQYTNATSIEEKNWYVAAAAGRISDNVLSYWTKTTRPTANSSYEGSVGGSIAVDKDVTIVYVDMNGKKAGPDIGVNKFDTATGFANIIFHTDSEGVVDVIFVESVGDKGLEGDVDGYGTKTTVTLVKVENFDDGEVDYSVDTPEVGAQFKVNIELTAAAEEDTTYTVTYGTGKAAVAETVTIAKKATKGSVTFTAVAGQTAVSVEKVTE